MRGFLARGHGAQDDLCFLEQPIGQKPVVQDDREPR